MTVMDNAVRVLVHEASPGELQNAISALGLELRRRLGGEPARHRRFVLERHEDVSGLSGTGMIAEGCQFTDGVTVLRWRGVHASVTVWSSIESVLAVHGHGARTQLRWFDG